MIHLLTPTVCAVGALVLTTLGLALVVYCAAAGLPGVLTLPFAAGNGLVMGTALVLLARCTRSPIRA